MAVDGSATPFADSFRITRGSAWWIWWLLLLGFVPIILVGGGLYLLQPQLSGGLAVVATAAMAMCSTFAYAVGVALASYLYTTRADWAEAQGAAVPSS